ncbi:MAG: hypothetical protein HC886_07550 [Leptolyngbyaceae cyanobacterium SM1_1_3]|nr:hypothetical protein [Leptolyngbyaceae cyanobacterium SM1_1_3]
MAIAEQQRSSASAIEPYLAALVYSYTQAQAAAEAIPYQQQLIEVYQAQAN